jgi:hypothetical protein
LSRTVFIPEFDEEQMKTGYMWVTKIDDKGPQRGMMPISEVVDTLRECINWDAVGRGVKLINSFADSPFRAWGQNGPKWVAVKEIPPSEYNLTTVTGLAFTARLPRLIAKVSNHGKTFLYWTEEENLSLTSLIYPLMIGNISSSGWVCLGTTGLQCRDPEDIDLYIRLAIEAPTTGTYLSNTTLVEEFYQSLTERWDVTVGAKYGMTLAKLFEGTH